MRERSKASVGAFESMVEEATASLYQSHPFFEGSDLVARLRALIDGHEFRAVLKLKNQARVGQEENQ